jgi:hypothetical protein
MNAVALDYRVGVRCDRYSGELVIVYVVVLDGSPAADTDDDPGERLSTATPDSRDGPVDHLDAN